MVSITPCRLPPLGTVTGTSVIWLPEPSDNLKVITPPAVKPLASVPCSWVW